MRVMKWSVVALAVAAGTSQLAMASAQSESNGIVADSSLNVLLRNTYIQRDYRDGYRNQDGWGQGFIATFESGFTQGTVGVGFDAFGKLGLKLDGGNDDGTMGGFLPPTDSDGKAKDSWGRAGGAVKARLSNTVLKYGEFMPSLPVVQYDDSRLLPETFTGTMLTSNEIEGLEINLGRLTARTGMNEAAYDAGNLKNLDFAGLSYAFTDNVSTAFYWAETEDEFKKYYGNFNWNIPLTDRQALTFDLNAYRTKYKANNTYVDNMGVPGYVESGDKNTIWSLAATYSIGAHAFTIAHQRNTGDAGYYYGPDGGGTIYLANSYYSDFNKKDERSWQARYDVDFADYGVPGLQYTLAYVRGTNIDTGADNGEGKERELFNQISYVVQSGPVKDLSFRVRHSVYRSSNSMSGHGPAEASTVRGYGNGGADVNEIRAFIEYPLSIL